MTTLDDVIPLIYHEKQQAGSMLCAQHALNSLLQEDVFTPMDLSSIAKSLDDLEKSYDDDNGGQTSTNMDDTGFFSVQVLDNALDVWGLDLVRWRSEEMRPYQDRPHTQLGFILNLQQHWFTLRRFGEASPNIDEDEGNGHWFNLNSFLEKPEWVSNTYLGMVLQQSETEGYSVFAVRQRDPHGHLALARKPADHLAAVCPAPTSSYVPRNTTAHVPRVPHANEGFEDEDLELQAALAASLGGGAFDSSGWEALSSGAGPSHLSGSATPRHDAISLPEPVPEPPAEPDDPVAASMARNRALLERMKREQEYALREGYEEEVATRFSNPTPAAPPGLQPPRTDTGEDNEEELLRRAILESEAAAREEGHPPLPERADADADADVNMPDAPPSWQGGARPPAHRVYDDDDAELQAALKASLESVPPGFTIPDSPPPASGPSSAPALPIPAPALSRSQSSISESGTETEPESEPSPQVQEQVSVEEMRRRRLARFGAA